MPTGQEYTDLIAQAYLAKQQAEQEQTTTPVTQPEPTPAPTPYVSPSAPPPSSAEPVTPTTQPEVPQSVEQRETQITTAIEQQDTTRQAIQQGIAMGVVSPLVLQEYEQSLKDITLKQEDISRLREDIEDYDKYFKELENAAEQGGYTIQDTEIVDGKEVSVTKELTPELVEKKRDEYKDYLDTRIQSTIAVTSPFSDLTTGKLNLASAIKLGAPQEQISALAQTISKNMPESTRVEPERLIELTKEFEGYRKGEDYNIGQIINETVKGNLDRQDVQDYFGKDTIDKVDVSIKLQNFKVGEEYNLEAIMDGLDSGTVSKDDVETLFGKDTLRFIKNYNEQVEEIQKETRKQIASVASDKDVDIKNVNEPTFTEIESLIRSGIDPINLVAAGYNINDINIAVAVINQEVQEWQNARDKLANAGFALPLRQVTEEYQVSMPFVATPQGKEFSIQNIAEWQRNNPEDTTTLETYFGKENQDFINEIQKYNDYLAEATREINSYINTPEQIGLRAQGAALDIAITELYEGVKAPDVEVKFINGNNVFYDVKTDELLSKKEVVKRRWEQLTPEQREEVALAFANDPNKYNLFAATNKVFNLVSEKGGLPTSIALSPITLITNPIAKQMTLGEAKEIIDREYETEREVLKDYIKKDGTFDINKLSSETSTDYTYRNRLLDDIGYEDIDTLKQNLEYYNDSIKVTAEEWTMAGATAIANALSFGGAGYLASLGALGKWVAFGLWTGAGGLMLPSSFKTLSDENASALEKGLALGVPIIMLSTGVVGLLPKSIGIRSAIGKVNIRVPKPKISPLERVGNSLDNIAYKISRFIADESSGTAKIPDIALPNVIKIVRDSYGRVSYELVGLGKQSALVAEKAVQEIVEQALKAKVYLKSGLKQEVIEALSNNLTQAKIAKGLAKYVAEEIKVGITKGVQFTDDMIERAIVKGMAAKEYLVGVSDDVRKAIVNSPQYVKYLAKEIGRNVNDRYNAIMDGLMVKGIMVTNQVADTMATVMQNIKNIPTTVARKAELAKYMYGVVKDDIVKIAGMTKDEAEKFIKQQIENAIKLQNRLEALPDNVDGAIGYMAREVVNKVKQNYARLEELRQEVLSTLIEDSFKAVDYLKYGLKEDIVASVNRNKKIAEYLLTRTKQGINRGVADSYSSANFKRVLTELDDAVKIGDKESMIRVADKLISMGDDVPRYQGISMAELGRTIKTNLIKSGDIVDEDTLKAIDEWLKALQRIDKQKASAINVKLDAVKEKYLKDSKQRIVEFADEVMDDFLKRKELTPEQIAQGKARIAELIRQEKLKALRDRYLQQTKQRIVEYADEVLDLYDETRKLTPEQIAQGKERIAELIRQEKINAIKNKYLAESNQPIVNLADDIIDNYLESKNLTPEQIAKRIEDLKARIIDEKLNVLKEKYIQNSNSRIVEYAEEVIDLYDDARKLTPDEIVRRLDDLKARTQAEKLKLLKETYSAQRESYLKELDELLNSFGDDIDKLGIAPDDIESLKKLIQKIESEKAVVTQKQTYQKELEGLLDELGDKLDDLDEAVKNNPDITPDEMDDIVRGDKGGGTAVREKTEVKPKTEKAKPKTAEELEEMFKEKVKPEVKPETKTKSQVSAGTGVIAPVTVVKSTYLGSELSTSVEEIPTPIKPPELEPLISPIKPITTPDTTPYTPMPETRDIPSIRILTDDEVSEEVEIFGEPEPVKEPERLPEMLGAEMFGVAPEEEVEPSGMLSPEPFKQPEPEAVEVTEPFTEEYPYPELIEQPIPDTPIPPDVPVKTPVKPIIPLKIKAKDVTGKEEEVDIEPGTVVWIQGRPTGGAMYKFVLPSTKKLYTTRETPSGYVDEGWEGKGAAKSSLQIIGGKPLNDIKNLDLGFARINIKVSGTEPEIEYVHDDDANVGARNKTVGRGRGQIPLEAWEEAKAEGQNYRDFIRNYKGELVGGKNKVIQDIYDVEEYEYYTPDTKAWYEEETITPIRRKIAKKEVNPYANYYRGREVLPPDLSGSL